jgi:tRNA(Ile)-lysidine synthase
MKLQIEPGKYLVAVSGGVDSVALLHALVNQGVDTRLTVAHFDHGIRADSAEDRQFVQQLAGEYGLPFVYDTAQLGAEASESVAREARYAFLQKAQRASGAQAIITAHHQDDALETAVINLLRGTGRKGLTSLTSGEGIIRPLLQVPKSELIDYAQKHGLTWHEDSTNTDTNYLRNHIRHDMLPKWSAGDKRRLLGIIDQMRSVNGELDTLLSDSLGSQLNRAWFTLLPHAVAREVMATWLRQQDVRDFDRGTLERLTVAAKVAEPGKAIDIVKHHRLHIAKDSLSVVKP